ncbi:hypothetical protein [Shouchella lonarensis]|uniref:Uncharacterized protein n=1 Tax=Shouchella lonarensis TaxID=1464122 RepID=A0A1G6GL58_9BACI|nr:hypothetical protein [Shouchella lonarensis]SDB82475.1 hypothetical protein SAMN05421737_101187 [Shouchella lonarensis]
MQEADILIEFKEISINLSKPALHRFIKQMIRDHYHLHWRYDASTIYLMLQLDDEMNELPFERNKDFLTLRANKLCMDDQILAEAVEQLLRTEKGDGIVKRMGRGPISMTSYQSGDIELMIEIDRSEKGMTNKHGSMTRYKDSGETLRPETIYNVTMMEIDYALMELFEALELKDKEKIALQKQRLKKLVSKRKEVEQLL